MSLRNHMTYANVMATIAVFGVIAGGGAYAASKIQTSDIAKKAITAKKLDGQVVKTSKLRDRAVASGKLRDRAVTREKLSDEVRASLPTAGLVVGADGAVEYWFNHVGDQPQVLHASGSGRYELSIPGVEVAPGFQTKGVQSVALEGEQGGEISVRRQVYSDGGSTPLIVTRDSAGNPSDRPFSYLVYGGESPPRQ